ncbi:MAG: efflux transporter outer membrane subunit [Nitrospiraceae bacterium]
MRRPILLAMSLLLLSACMMGPNYQRPAMPTPEAWRLAPATSESIANLPWWELFKDGELQKLIRTSLEENLDLRVAAATVEQFQNQLVIAKFDLVPSLEYGGNAFGYRNTNNNVLPVGGGAAVPAGGKAGGLSLTYEKVDTGLKWELDLWGRIRRNIEATRAQLLARAENQRGVIIGLVSNVAQSYFTVRALDLQVEIAARTLKAWDEAVRLTRSRYQQGYVSKLDLDRFEAEQAGTKAQLANLEKQVVQAENQLSVLLGRKPMRIPRGLALTEQPMPPNVPPGLPSDLLRQRPDILQAEQELAAATANIGVSEAMRFPQLALTGAVGGAGFQISGSSVGPFAIFSGSASLTGPLLNATALGYQVKVSEAQTKKALAQYENAILTAFKEVEDALIAVQKTREQREAQEAQVAALQSALTLADKRYRGGFASYLDVLTAQRDLFQAELGLASTRQQNLVSVVQLYKALGGGWSPARPSEAETQPVSPSGVKGGG